MDFVTRLSKATKGCDSILVVVDRLTKSPYFIPIKNGYPLQKLVELYVEKIVGLHGISSSIVSDRDMRFTSRFWQSLQEELGTKLKLSSSYHSQTDGQTKNWDSYFFLIEFTYNNNFHSSIRMAPFEVLYGKRCSSHLCWYESGECVLIGPEIVQQITEKIKVIQEKMSVSHSH